jgi:hypothetical protein
MAKTMTFNTLGVKWQHTAYIPHSLDIFKAFDAVITASYGLPIGGIVTN